MPLRTLALSALLAAFCSLLSGCGGGGTSTPGPGTTAGPGPAPGPTTAPGPAPAVGEPLIITDMLKAGNFSKAQTLTKVDLSAWGWNSAAPLHSGFMQLAPLGSAKNRETFFMYSAAQSGNKNAPVLLWLQGGPGASSLFGMFTEIGPFGIANGTVQPRAVNWNQDYHLFFLDNPVGTGFSFTDSDAGYATTHEQAGEDLRNAISQFFMLFPDLRANDFYITGESYAGKWVPAAAYTCHTFNKNATKDTRINLKGISIGDGAMDPAAQFQGFGDLLWFLGMVDESERKVFKTYEDTIQTKFKAGDYVGSFEAFDEMLNGDFYPYGTYYANVTGMGSNYFNFELSPDATPLGGDFVSWLNLPQVRAQIHVGGRSYAPFNGSVELHLKNAWMQGVVPMLVPLMENYKVLVYSGQNDVILGPPLTEQFLYALNWTGKADYQNANKKVWRRSALGPGSKLPDVCGYVRTVGNFTQAVVRGAGHMVPGDQPERALDMLTHFIAGTPFVPTSKKVVSEMQIV